MISTQPAHAGGIGWQQSEPALVPESAEDVVLGSLRVMQLNGRCLYLKVTAAIAELTAGEIRILEALAHQGDTVFVAVGHPGQIQMSYRMPDLENAVAFDAQGLEGVIGQWFAWASTTDS